ncbi:MAG: hypothetical protein ABIZ80_06660 [Bryobacteraceae bacterium]
MTTRRSRYLPSLADFLFAAVLGWVILFSIGNTGFGLLQDASTGTHIRTGDYIREHAAVPRTDMFSFSKPGDRWFAFEWLWDVLFSFVHQLAGLKGVILLSAGMIALLHLILLLHMLWRGANAILVVVALNLGVGAMSIHFLARPHLFTMLFLAGALILLDRDEREPTRAIWWLVPASIPWVNLHPGFLALPVSLAIFAAGKALESLTDAEHRGSLFVSAIRYGLLSISCIAASGINPYGFAVHLHVLKFMSEKWVSQMVYEHQPPRLGTGAMIPFEILLVCGGVFAIVSMRRRQFAWPLLMLAWSYAALHSSRHIAIYTLITLPLIAGEAGILWNRWAERLPRRSIGRTLADLAAEHTPNFQRVTLWTPLVFACFWFTDFGLPWPNDFPSATNPVAIAARQAKVITSGRLFTTDAWADYLNYRNYPNQKLFVDGRSDFFGEDIFKDYLRILNGEPGWDLLLDKYQFTAVLTPVRGDLARQLDQRSGWRLLEKDNLAALLERVTY